MTVEWVIAAIAATILIFYGAKALYARGFEDGWMDCARRQDLKEWMQND